jgi:hypothetical protein
LQNLSRFQKLPTVLIDPSSYYFAEAGPSSPTAAPRSAKGRNSKINNPQDKLGG